MASHLTIGRKGPLLVYSALLIILLIGFVCNAYLRFSTVKGYPKESSVSDSAVEKDCVLNRVFGKGFTVTALASPPGSGNTWVRNLLEESTGGCKPMCDVMTIYPVIRDISSWRLPTMDGPG